MIIGLSGYARSGKDEAARALVEGLSFKRVAFADVLRDFLLAINPIVGLEHAMSVVRARDVITEWGWDGYKSSPYGKEIREILQRLGTEGGRDLVSDTIWIDAAFRRAESYDDVVITDTRFPNEAQAIKDRGGSVVRIERPGITAANAHISETALDDWDFDVTIPNAGSIDDLHANVRVVALMLSVA